MAFIASRPQQLGLCKARGAPHGHLPLTTARPQAASRIPGPVSSHTAWHHSCQQLDSSRRHRQPTSSVVCRAIEEVVLPELSPQALEQDRHWLSVQVTTWLNEEWTPLDVHTQLGEAAADAYVRARQEGESEMGGLLLSITSQLMAFNYYDTFTDAFEVGNKVSELLMLRQGCDVCCTSQDDKDRYLRVDEQLSAMMKPKAE